MKQSKIERKRMYRDFWHECLRWTLALFLLASLLTTALLVYFKLGFHPLVYIILFFICFFVAWIFMFRKQPMRKDFEGDN